MARPKPWLKMWTEWIHDPKMLGLTLAEQGAWWKIVTLAQQCAAEGQLVKSNGSPLSLPEMANSLHLSTPRDIKTLQSMIKKMEAAGSLVWSSNILTIVHFAERQSKVPSESKEAVRERVRRHREGLSVTDNSLPPAKNRNHVEVPPPHPPPNKETEAEAEGNDKKVVTRNGKTVTAKATLAEISKLHEETFGIITPFLAEKFKDFVENYRGPVEWIKEAFAEAVKYKNRRWQYVEAILYSWQEKGGPHADRRGPGGERGRLGADQRDPIASYREEGWEILGEDEPEAGNQGR